MGGGSAGFRVLECVLAAASLNKCFTVKAQMHKMQTSSTKQLRCTRRTADLASLHSCNRGQGDRTSKRWSVRTLEAHVYIVMQWRCVFYSPIETKFAVNELHRKTSKASNKPTFDFPKGSFLDGSSELQ